MTEVLLEKMSQYVQPKYLNFILWLAKPSSSDPYGKNLTSYDKLKQFFVQGMFILHEVRSYYYIYCVDEKHRAHVHCIIQLAAVIFGNTEHSCHLYDHLFNPKDISTDFIPGSVVYENYITAMYIMCIDISWCWYLLFSSNECFQK